MPVFEFACSYNEDCSGYREIVESFLWHWDDQDVCCSVCGARMVRMVSGFNAPFTGTLDRYNEKGFQTNQAAPGGHWAYRTKSARHLDKKTGRQIPERVLIDSIQKQKEYCRDEGLHMPNEVNPNVQATDDGMNSSSRLRGSWV